MSDDDKIIGAALRAAVDGPFFPDFDFRAITGFDRAEMRLIADEWPKVSNQQETDSAVNAALNNLTGYPHGDWDAWRTFSSCTPEELKAVYSRWWFARDARPSRDIRRR